MTAKTFSFFDVRVEKESAALKEFYQKNPEENLLNSNFLSAGKLLNSALTHTVVITKEYISKERCRVPFKVQRQNGPKKLF